MNKFSFILGTLFLLSATIASAGVGSIGSPLLQNEQWQELAETGEIKLSGQDPSLENQECEVSVSQMTYFDESRLSVGVIFQNRTSSTTDYAPITTKTKTGYEIRIKETAMPRYYSSVTIETDFEGKPLKVRSFAYDLLRMKLHKGECVIN